MTIRRHASAFASAPRWTGALAVLSLMSGAPALADVIDGQVLGAGAPIEDSTVTLWAAGGGAPPTQLAQAQTAVDGRFKLSADSKGAYLYIVANGGRAVANAAGGENSA